MRETIIHYRSKLSLLRARAATLFVLGIDRLANWVAYAWSLVRYRSSLCKLRTNNLRGGVAAPSSARPSARGVVWLKAARTVARHREEAFDGIILLGY